MKRYIYYLFLVLLPLLTACERAIPYNGEYQDPKLVIQSVVCAGEQSLACFVGRSYFFLDDKPYTPEVLDNLTFDIEAGKGPYTILSDSADGRVHYLKLSQIIQADDTFRLTVSHPQFGTATAQEVLLPDFKPEVIATEWQKSEEMAGNKYIIRMRLPEYPFPQKVITIKDTLYITSTTIRPVYNEDHTIARYDTVVRNKKIGGIYSRDEIFANMGNAYISQEGAYLSRKFKATYPKDKEMEVYISIGDCYDRTDQNGIYRTYVIDSCELSFTALSDTYSLYMSSMDAYLGMNNQNEDEYDLGALISDMIGIEEPVAIYSNVENGFGIVMSKTKTILHIK